MVVEHVSNSSYLAYLPREQMDPIDARKGPINDKKVHIQQAEHDSNKKPKPMDWTFAKLKTIALANP